MTSLLKKLCSFVIGFIFLLVCFTFTAQANEVFAYTLSGNISNSTSGNVSGATVNVVDTSTNISVGNTSSDNSGNYGINLNGGTYNIQVTPPAGSGFSSVVVPNRTITSDSIINFVLVPPGTVTLSGHILDPLGNPVSNVSLALRASNSTIAETSSDTLGNYSLQVSSGTYELDILGGGGQNLPPSYQLIQYNFALMQSTIVDITIPAKRLDIHVQSSAGSALSNISLKTNINAYTNSGLVLGGNINNAYGTSQYYPNPVTTDNSGNATMWLIPATTTPYSITATPPSGSIYSITTVSNITAASNGSTTITMQQPSIVSGHVFDPLGNPVANVSLLFRANNSTIVQTQTDATGSYSLQVSNGTYEFWIQGGGGPNLPPFYQLIDFSYAVSGNITEDINIPAKKISLHVQDTFNQAVSNVSLTTNFNAYSNGLTLSNTFNNAYGTSQYYPNPVTTDNSGNATMWLIPAITSTYRITATPQSGSGYSATSISNITASSDSNYIITLQKPVTLTGHIVDPLGNPAPSLTLMLRASNSTVAQTSTDSSGGYTMQVSAGTYEFWIQGSGQNLPQNFTIVDYNFILGQNASENITIPAKRLDIHIQNEAGDPQNNILLRTGIGAKSNSGIVLNSDITNAYGESSYYPNGVLTNDSGNATMWLLPATSTPYMIFAIPPTGSIYATYNLANLQMTQDLTEIISLQYVHAPPVTLAILSPAPNSNGIYPDPTTISLSATAASGFTVAHTYYAIDAGAQQTYTLPFTVSGDGSHTITYWSIDNAGVPEAANSKNFTIQANQAPTVNPLSGSTINEGDAYSASGSFTDSDSTSWTGTVDYGDGSGSQALTLSGINFSLGHVYKDNGSYTLTVSIKDNQGATGTATATITVNNVSPIVGTITATVNPVQINSATVVSASFTDPGVLDTHTASWNWGDGNVGTGTVTELNGAGSVSNSHTYTTAGVYPVVLTITDKDGGVGTSTLQYLVSYNPTGGFLTGSGKYNSLAGWEFGNAQATGEVKFGVSAQYQTGFSTPSGQMKINFKVGSLDFSATTDQWLVVSGAKATLKGNGTVNGSGNYTFILSGIDGSQAGGQNLIRVKITDSSNIVVYDTQPGADDTADPTTAITSGVIKVH